MKSLEPLLALQLSSQTSDCCKQLDTYIYYLILYIVGTQLNIVPKPAKAHIKNIESSVPLLVLQPCSCSANTMM